MLFSVVIYDGINRELGRVEHFEKVRQERFDNGIQLPSPSRDFRFNPQTIAQSRDRLLLTLGLINLGILVFSGAAGYFLAGITLRPIKEMIDDQNRFVTDASHELRTPLTTLRTEIEVGLRDKNLTVPQSKKLLESNLEEVIALQALSDNLINLTTYHKSNGSVAFTKLSLAEVMEKALKKITSAAKQKNIQIEKNVKDFTVMGDKQSLTDLFVILLDNAIKYSPEKSKIAIKTTKTDHSVLIKIKDEGIGIDKKDIAHIFDRFYRADKARSKTDSSGYGLGLSIAKNIVDAHGGTISVESNANKGTTFTVKL